MALGWGRLYLMREPEHFTISYSTNPRMDTTVRVDLDRAREQWAALMATLETTPVPEGAEVRDAGAVRAGV